MIRLHSPFEGVVMVSPERITHVKPDHERPERTRVYFDDDYITVRESVEEVVLKVLEWRLAMERYRAAYAEVMRNSILAGPDLEEAEQCMLKLAGLEEPNHDAR